MTPSVSDALAVLRDKFARQLPAKLDDINLHFQRLNPANWQPPDAVALHHLLHALTGSAGTFGMKPVSDAARTMETRLSALLMAVSAPNTSEWQTLNADREHLVKISHIHLQSDAPSLMPPTQPHFDRSPLIHLVEDDPAQADHLSLALREEGYRVQVFAEPAAFRAACSVTGNERPAAVVMDMMFPEGDTEGALMIAELGLGKGSNIPVAVVSVRDDLAARLAAFRAGACRYLVKPANTERLINLLDELSGRQPPEPYRILLVDDEALLLEAQSLVLRSHGMEVRTLSHPLKILEALDEFMPDVIVLDVYMPEASGPELAAVLRERAAQVHVPILFLSSETDMTQQLLALNLGGDDFLVKPVNPDHLIAAVTGRARRARQNLAVRQRLQFTLYEREREHLALNQHAIVTITDQSGNITYANDKFCTISGYSHDELIGQNNRVHQSDQHPLAFYKNISHTVSNGEVWHGEMCNRRRDGSLYWTESTITPFLDGEGKPYQYVSIHTDITAHKHAEQALIAARDEAEHANMAKSEFLSNMSHELRTPMNAILGFGQIMEYDTELPEEHRDNVQEILKAGQHLLELINEVLDLSKVESGKITLSLEPVEIQSVVEECISLVKPLADKHDIRLSHCALEEVAVRADRTRLRQALLNLLSNAVKYNRAGGTVHLDLKPLASNRVRIQVTDTGKGIPGDRLSELFQPFNRMGAENSDIEGTGIGLTITRRIVEMMGGTVDVESKAGIGSTFWIELPLESLPSHGLTQSKSSDAIAIQPTPAKRHTVLYIEDNPSSMKLVAQLLGWRKNIRLLSANTPEQGVSLALTQKPDLILLDINMPGMNGYLVLKVLKARVQMTDVPIIAITANAMPHDIARGLKSGFDDYLTKPIDVANFFNMLDRFLPDTAKPATGEDVS